MTVGIAEVQLDVMTPADLPGACELVRQFDRSLVEEAHQCFLDDLAHPAEWPTRRYRLVARFRGSVVGTMGYGPGAFVNPGVLWTDWLVVDEAWRRRGLASMIYQQLEVQLRNVGCRRVFLDVGTVFKQPDAIAFHSRHGYRIEGILQDYWDRGDDLVVMAKTLGSRGESE
jgi:GNAT superfamily N-acetyltransferase